MSKIHKTASYKTISDSGGNCYRFFCELSGMEACVTEAVKADDAIAWSAENDRIAIMVNYWSDSIDMQGTISIQEF